MDKSCPQRPALPLDLIMGGSGFEGVMIKGLTADSRSVSEGDIFAAFPPSLPSDRPENPIGQGVKAVGLTGTGDGRAFIEMAIKKGAAAILSTPSAADLVGHHHFIADPNPRQRYAYMAARYYGKQPACVMAVTGTNGKSSVVDFARQYWTALDRPSASLGTLGLKSDAFEQPGGLTTPDAMQLMGQLYQLAVSGIDHVAIEASSHGLDQYRLDGVHLAGAAFTNLSRDHLDYHHSLKAYFYAKLRLFGEILRPGSAAVVHIDDEYGQQVSDLAWGRGLRLISVGASAKADIRLVEKEALDKGQRLRLSIMGQDHELLLPLFGDFQASNILVAMGLCLASGLAPADLVAATPKLVGVKGRLEKIGTLNGASIFIDYAHSPGGLETLLKAMRVHQPKRLSLVFGCGGDRDRGKRAEMGAVAEIFADRIYVTDDNPRGEEPASIRSAIMAYCPKAVEIGDRARAIRAAMQDLQSGDMLVIAGKGHEEGQMIKGICLPFSDHAVVRALLAEAGGV